MFSNQNQEDIFFSDNEDQINTRQNSEWQRIDDIINAEKKYKKEQYYQSNQSVKIETNKRKRGRPRKEKSTQKPIIQKTFKQIKAQKIQKTQKNQQQIPINIVSIKKIDISRNSLHQIFFQYCDQTQSLRLVKEKDNYFIWVFEEILEDLRYRLHPKQRSSSNCKIRSQLIRKLIEQYLRKQTGFSLKQDSQRLNAYDKRIYEKQGIECECVHQIYSKDIDLLKKKNEFSELKKPMTFAEVKQFQNESQAILRQFGNCKKD